MGTGSPGNITECYILLNGPGGNMQTMSFQANGTWDGATLQYQVSNDNSNWVDARDAIGGNLLKLTADGAVTVLSSNAASAYGYARLAITGGGGSDDIVVTVYGGRG